jgi:tryptophanyl-tRNA synthetase
MRIFSGIKPTGDPTLGNFSGGFRQYGATQELGEAFFCIVDLHAITVEYEPEDLSRRTLDLAAMLLATGIDPERSTLFVQSHVPAHPQAAWLLSAVTGYGQLARMTQFKEKGEQQRFVSAALFNYPVLMAGDILLYRSTHVPIGDDQRQHLELARDIAERFNTRFGETFIVPDAIYPEAGARVMDLQDPTDKMGKTGSSDLGTVRMLDEPDAIRRKFRSAVTDSGREVVYDRAEKPGIANLLEVLEVATGEPIPSIEEHYRDKGYGDFKQDVAEAVVELLSPIRKRYEALRADEASLLQVMARGADRARAASAPVVEEMCERMGFVRPSP